MKRREMAISARHEEVPNAYVKGANAYICATLTRRLISNSCLLAHHS